MFNTLFLIPLAAVLQGPPPPTQAPHELHKARITIITQADGRTERVTREFDADNAEELHAMLQSIGSTDPLAGPDASRTSEWKRDTLSLEQFLLAGYGKGGRLGVSTTGLTESRMRERQVKAGAYVENVVSGSAAEKLGLREGDIITSLNGTATPGPEALVNAVRAHPPGETVEVTWLRGKKQMNGRIELDEAPNESFSFSLPTPDSEGFIADLPPLPPMTYLGVTTEEEEGNGPRVSSVAPGSPADAMGLQEGDIIRTVDGAPISSFMDLSRNIRAHQPEDTVEIGIVRNGQALTVTGQLGRSPEGLSRAMPFTWERDLDFQDDPSFDAEGMRRELERLRQDMEDLRLQLGREHGSAPGANAELPDAKEWDMLKAKGLVANGEELALPGLSLYTGPDGQVHHLRFNATERGDLKVAVFDDQGKGVYEERITSFKGRYDRKLDLSELAKGGYFLIITQHDRSVVRRLLHG